MKRLALAGYAAVFFAFTATAASYATPAVHGHAQRFITALPGSVTLVDQNGDDSGASALSSGGSQAFDNFVVPRRHTWIVKEVDVTGIYVDGLGPASSEDVNFYVDNHGLPNAIPLVVCKKQKGVDNGSGSFAIELSKKCKVSLSGSKHHDARKKSRSAIYWVSVVANFPGGEGDWGWEINTDKHSIYALCPPGGGICGPEPGNLMFDLKGKDER